MIINYLSYKNYRKVLLAGIDGFGVGKENYRYKEYDKIVDEEEIAKLNHWKHKILILKTDVFQFLKNMKETEVIVLDPPAFIKSHKDIKKGEKKYESLFSMGIVKAKEYCFVSSCSHFLTRENFFDMVMRCLRKSGKEGIILHQGFQAGDHPVNPFVKETLYLKSFLLKF